MQLSEYLDNVRRKNPLVHHITNYVTVNDCANACLAIGASPVMADAIDEAGSMASISSALVLNIGTLNVNKVESMMVAGRSANAGHKPVVFDPVGCGATPFRNRMADEIMNNVSMTVVRGNMSEIASLGGQNVFTKGVDAGETADIKTAIPMAASLAEKWHSIVVISGETDIITDGKKTVLIHNGCPEMSLITGSGCMCTTVIGAFCGANPEHPLESAAAAMGAMGLAGERAWKDWGKEGFGHFHMAIIDELGKMTGKSLEQGVRYEEC
ncbi:hydroxyethylthiazole kinase [Dialister sp.]|uniref:hydroxyethylthiazole kinase n=1 Tax=Dialister sp. TaxID=1955814 RepID=UPI0025F2EB21|nr:hydroxyethylthiazole kinase [Dialister sp.]